MCRCDGISFVDSVVPATDKLPALTETEMLPLTACDANAVVNATEPPELAVPDTTLNALLSCVVTFVNPVGAAVWTNSITVPEGITVPLAAGAVEFHVVPLDVNTFPVVLGATN